MFNGPAARRQREPLLERVALLFGATAARSRRLTPIHPWRDLHR